MFHMYDKNLYKHDVTMLLTPSPCHKLSHLLGPPSSMTYFMDGPFSNSTGESILNSLEVVYFGDVYVQEERIAVV